MLAVDVAKYLDAAGIVSYDEAGATGNAFVDKLPPSPDLAVALFSRPGLPAGVHNAVDDQDLTVQVRGTKDPRTAQGLAEQIRLALHGLTQTELVSGGTFVTFCRAMQGQPNSIGVDDNGRHQYTVNLRFRVRR